jgi:preprotein translocase subunit SecF
VVTAVYLLAAFLAIVAVGATLALIHDAIERRLE